MHDGWDIPCDIQTIILVLVDICDIDQLTPKHRE